MVRLIHLPIVLCLLGMFVEADPTPATTTLNQNITIYYEALCPYSAKLIKQLNSNYDTLVKPYFNLTLVPFGGANITESPFKMQCVHGDFECQGDRIHACLLKGYSSLDFGAKIKFIDCTMNTGINGLNGSVQFNTSQCESIIKPDDVKDIVNCSQKEDSEKYMVDYQSLTKIMQTRITNAGLPVVVFNNDFNVTTSKNALNDLKSTLCANIPDNKPDVCGTTPGYKGGAIYLTSSFVLSVFLIAGVHHLK